ncbi:MAG: hypothetical protein L6R37_003239 [Teloschistes peruensis]|nr:MAG: hypothetical protein L6R37_003239 [Teloschistes peruensis]
MATTSNTEAKELDLVNKVELRIVLTDSESKLQSLLHTYLPPLLLKLASDHKSVRNKVISICQHVNTRIQPPKIKLPVAGLLKQYKENTNALIRYYDLLYIQQGLQRLPVSDRTALLPTLIHGINKNFHESARNTAALFNLLLKLLHSLPLPPRGSTDDLNLRQQLGLEDEIEDARFITFWIGKLIFFAPNPPSKHLPGLDAEECSFLQLYDRKDTWQPGLAGGMNLVDTKVVAVKFVASGAFTDTERYFPALFASSDPNSRLADVGDDMMKRTITAVSLEDRDTLDRIFGLYLGTRGNNGSLPAPVPLQIKLLTLLCKSKSATSYQTENIRIVKEGLTSSFQGEGLMSSRAAKGLEASKLRTQIFAYTNWLARVSEISDIGVIAPSLVSQLRDFIESQGWPTMIDQIPGQGNHGVSLRGLAYESIGVLAKASPTTLLLDEDLDLLRWLFNSLAADSAGRDVSLSIEQALSSVLGAFSGDSSSRLKLPLEGLLLHNMQRQPGDTEDSDIKVIRSTRFAAVRFANRCLPFSNIKARWINILAIGSGVSERKEMLEEGSKGLDPYWYRMLNPDKPGVTQLGHSSNPRHQWPLLEELVNQFFDEGSVWNTERSSESPMPMMDAYGPAILFCRNILISEALSSEMSTIDGGWDQQLDTTIRNDEHVRVKIRDHLYAMVTGSTTRKALETLLMAAFKGVTASGSKSAALCCESLLQLCSLSPGSSIARLAREGLASLKECIFSNDRSLRDSSSHLFGILGSHYGCNEAELLQMIDGFDVQSRGWKDAVGSDCFRVHGAMLATAYFWSRRDVRVHTLATQENEAKMKVAVDRSLEILNISNDKTLLDAAINSITELSLFGILSPKSLSAPYSASGVVKKLSEIAAKGNESAVKALGSFAMQCDEELTDDAVLHEILVALFKLHEVRDPSLHFAVGEALSCAAAGWHSKALIAAADIEGQNRPSSNRSVSLSWILERVIEDCKTTKPTLRQAIAIWLLCLVQFCGHLPPLQERLRDCQVAFKGFLADRESLNQETASRGLSLVYEKGDRSLKDDLVRDLVGSFTGSSADMAGRVSGETQLFEPGALPTGDGSITTYKDIMSLAAEVGNPSLVYQFMSLAANNAIWTSRAALGRFGLSTIFSDSSVDGYLAQNPKLYPALFRYRFDPNTNVRNSMNDIWTALVHEPTATIDQHFDSIMSDLLKNILGKEWRTRQACCAAVADLVQSRPAAKYQKYVGEIWTLTFKAIHLYEQLIVGKVCDDIKESVRTAAMALASVLVGILTRGLEASDSSSLGAGEMLKNVLPFLLSSSGLESPAEDVEAFSLAALLQIIKKSSKDILRPFVPDLVGRLILLLSSLEPEGIEYIRLRAEQYGLTGQQIDDARLSGVRGSPMLEAIERCLDFLDETSMQELRRPLENAITTGLGLPSRVGGSRVLVSLSTRHNYIFRPHANHFLRLARKQVLDRNETISASYSAACGYLTRLASDEEILRLVEHCRKLYFESEDERHRVVAGEIILAMSKYATDRFNALAADILPFVFVAKHDSYEQARTLFKDTWNETVGGSRAVLLYMQEIFQLALQYLDSPRWSLKHTAAFTIAEAINATGDGINDSIAQIIWLGLQKAVDGKTWEGKERVLEAFVKFARAENAVTKDEKIWAQIKKIMLRESKRNNVTYRPHALACLATYVELGDSIDLATEVYEITAPIIEDLLAGSDEMDLESRSGGPSSKTVKVHEAIIDAEKSLFQKLQRAPRQSSSETLVTVLNEYLQILFGTKDAVEQTRLKAAEAAAAFAPLTGTNERLRAALIDAIGRTRRQERSVPVQEALERARRAIPYA